MKSRVLWSSLFVLGCLSVSFFLLTTPTSDVSLNALTWAQPPLPILLTQVEHEDQTGLRSIRPSDGSSAFFAGDWQVSFDQSMAFAFQGPIVLVVTDVSVRRIELDDPSVQVQSIRVDETGHRLAIVTRLAEKTRICFTQITNETIDDCQTLDINKPADVRWQQDLPLVKVGETELYTYTLAQSAMKSIDAENEASRYEEVAEQFAETPESSASIPLPLGLLSTTQQKPPFFIRLGLSAQEAIWLDSDHLLIKQKNAVKILERSTRRLATLIELPHASQARLHSPMSKTPQPLQ